MDNKYDVFISYSRHDTNVVNEFVDRLEREGFSVWIDRDGIESGDVFKRIILQAIKNSAVVLFFSSQHSNQSGWTAKEVGVAVKYQKPIIPILIDGSNYNEEVEFDLINLDFIDYQDVSVRGPMMDRLVKSLKAKIPNPIGQKKAEEARLKAEAAERERLEQERRRKEETERREREEAERKAREEADRKTGEAAKLKALQDQPAPKNIPRNKKPLWIALGAIAALALLLLLLLKPKKEEPLSVSGNVNGHDYVDLGLPSGTLWATCNIGASRPEDYGDYYAWGETQTKSVYSWETYKYANGDYNNLTKYCSRSIDGDNGFTDMLTTLQSGDDPATTWGSGWHTPTKEQWDELLENTVPKGTKQNGVQGCLFIARNGLSLFLPAACSRLDDDELCENDVCCYWSSTLDDLPFFACCLFSFNSEYGEMGTYLRCIGFSVRPVRSSR